METMGLMFFHLCSQTCPGRELWAGQDVASRKVLRGGSREVLEPLAGVPLWGDVRRECWSSCALPQAQ